MKRCCLIFALDWGFWRFLARFSGHFSEETAIKVKRLNLDGLVESTSQICFSACASDAYKFCPLRGVPLEWNIGTVETSFRHDRWWLIDTAHHFSDPLRSPTINAE